jgi:hypothetical protein
MRVLFVTICLTGLLALAAPPVGANTLGFEVLVNTAPLIGNPAGPYSLDFQLIGSGPNTAIISGFDFGGGGAVGPAFPSGGGGATGDLNSSVMLSDSLNFANELYERFTPGNTLFFFVTLTTNVTPTPDAFSFAILDGNLFTIPTTGLGDSLVLVNITNATLTPRDIQTFTGLNLPGGPNYANVTALAVPEPASLFLLATGLAAVMAGRLRRQRPAA